jgi:hypothetical protein
VNFAHALRANRKEHINSVPTDESIEAEEEREENGDQPEGESSSTQQANIPNPQTDTSGTNPAE